MIQRLTAITIGLAIMAWAVALPSFAEGPDFFNPAIYADGEVWATKGLGTLPPPNGHNNQSFDKLYVFPNDNNQLPVAEAAPGNPNYNGGRWWAQRVTWLIPHPPIVMSYAELEGYRADGFLMIEATTNYFECPLLPFKQ